MKEFDFEGKKVLVTGGAGFIGSHLVDRLVEKDADVTVLDNLSSGYKENLAGSWEDIEFVEGDVRNEKRVRKTVEEKDVIFHLAANTSVPTSVEKPKLDYETNSTGTFNLLKGLKAINRNEIENFVYASTAAIYGEPEYTPIDENHPLKPISPYGASKLSGEKIGFAFNEVYNIPFTALRIFNVYGPRQRKYVMYDFVRKLKTNPGSLVVLGSGEQKRSFCYVDDSVEAFLLAGRKGKNEVYNLAGDSLIEIGELAELITSKISPQAEIKYTGESWRGDIKELVPDNSKIKEKLGFNENISLNQGIERLIDWMKTGE